MARHRKSRKTHRRHRRSVGAVSVKKIGMKVAGVAAGAFVARTVNNMVVKQFPTLLSGWMIGAGDVVLGVLVPKFVKSDFGQAVGDGFIAIGALTALQGLGVLQGLGAMPVRIPAKALGARSTSFLSRTVGANPRPFIRKTVGATGSAYNMMETMDRQALGACGLGSLYAEE